MWVAPFHGLEAWMGKGGKENQVAPVRFFACSVSELLLYTATTKDGATPADGLKLPRT